MTGDRSMRRDIERILISEEEIQKKVTGRGCVEMV